MKLRDERSGGNRCGVVENSRRSKAGHTHTENALQIECVAKNAATVLKVAIKAKDCLGKKPLQDEVMARPTASFDMGGPFPGPVEAARALEY